MPTATQKDTDEHDVEFSCADPGVPSGRVAGNGAGLGGEPTDEPLATVAVR
jgi:hypothetical protein